MIFIINFIQIYTLIVKVVSSAAIIFTELKWRLGTSKVRQQLNYLCQRR